MTLGFFLLKNGVFFWHFFSVFGGWGSGVPPGDLTIPLAPADFLYHGWGYPPCTIFFSKKKSSHFFFVVQILFSGLRPEKKWGPKLRQKVVFWLKKCEKFRIQHPFFCRKKNYHTNETEKTLCTERHFSIEKVFLKNIYRKKFPKIPKFC